MKLLILGATGETGKELLMQALQQHHDVTVLVRDPAKLIPAHEKLTVIKGDVLDKDVVMKALQGKDAVLSALGQGKSLKATNLISGAVNILIPAMYASGVKRLIFLSAFGVGQTFAEANLLQKIIFRFILKNIYADKAKAEVQLRSSTLDWTLVYPVLLTNKLHTGKYQAAEKIKMKGTPKIPRADVADFMLRQLHDTTFLKKGAVIMS